MKNSRANLGIGIIEGFFGPEWTWPSRHQFCESLPAYGGDFYIYAPKRDPYLRKNWTLSHPAEMWTELKSLSSKCRSNGIQFGVGLSPFEIHSDWTEKSKRALQLKIDQLQDLEIKYLGIFFDDMRGAPDLADKQLEILQFVKGSTDTTLLFCPTYYSSDPILDKVFGQRESDYLERIGSLPKEIQILWTGNKVISPTISAEDLEDVTKVLRRKPLIWDNYFANDGPKQCKFLKLKAFEGRSREALQSSSGWALNLMNQPSLSEIVFASSVDVLKNGTDPASAFDSKTKELAGEKFELLLRKNQEVLNVSGLDKTDSNTLKEIGAALGDDRFSQDIKDWIDGKYLVGPECLTD